MTDQSQTTTEPVEAFESDLSLINSTPALLSLLYDANMLPELVVDERDAISIVVACEAYRLGRTTHQPLAIGLDREAVARVLHSNFGRVTENWSSAPKEKWHRVADRILALAAPAEGWQGIETAPKDGADLVLWDGQRARFGSWRVDEGFATKEPMWLDDSYDDYSCGFASVPLTPTHWMPLPAAPTGKTGA